ncbi:hypothetical protein C5167_039458 [Papaver somniferum]|uniref:Choline transporter-like protein n=1 Tax=Papaver somniferum TaxID=3469 RepID=A0A4Y7IC58_PAPSO|nr:hypothetical protein C5167_039458 [Papaver somniferum]
MTIVMAISVLSSLAIIRRILMATSVLKVAAKVIGEVQALIIFPIMPYTLLAIFYMFWFSAALHLFSSGQILQNDCKSDCCAYDLKSKKVMCDRCCGYSIHYTPHIAIAILFHLFGCYWATQFFIAFSATVIAGSVASYYWARNQTSKEIPFLPVFSSMKRLMRYNLGSVAIGSLIVSFIASVRYVLESIRRKLKGGDSTYETSWIGKVRSGSSGCCLGCINWTVRSVNRNAYIMVTWCLGYVVASLFFAVVEMSIDTIILSFCQDSEEHQGTAQYAPPLLMETLNEQNEVQRLTQGFS